MTNREKITEEMQNRATRKVKSKAKRKARSKIKRIHPLSFVIWILCLALGAGLGVGAYKVVSANDRFVVRGEKSYVLPIGTEVTYKDKGVQIISFGRDISDKVQIETNLTETDEDGVYTIDTSQGGEYYIIYTVDDIKYGEIQRVRTITVKGEN